VDLTAGNVVQGVAMLSPVRGKVPETRAVAELFLGCDPEDIGMEM
jgi:hypothetical protein